MSDRIIRSRDPQIRAVTDRNERLAELPFPSAQHTREGQAARAAFDALNPDQRRTMRYNTAANIRRAAEEAGQTRLLRILDHGFMPGGMGSLIHIDSGRHATAEERRAIGRALRQ